MQICWGSDQWSQMSRKHLMSVQRSYPSRLGVEAGLESAALGELSVIE
jgi:hypothetical protein